MPAFLLMVCLVLTSQVVSDGSRSGVRRSEGNLELARADFQRRRLAVFPYLENDANLLDLLRFRSVRAALKVDSVVYRRVLKRKADADKEVLARYESVKDGPGAAKIAAISVERAIRGSVFSANRKELTDDQWERLEQIAFHCEIAYLGPAIALTRGKLSDRVGVTDNQKSHLFESCQKLRDSYLAAVRNENLNLHERALAILSPSEKTVADEMLGEYFPFQSRHWSNARVGKGEFLFEEELHFDRDAGSIADRAKASSALPRKKLESRLGLVRDSQVQAALGLTEQQISAIAKIPFSERVFSGEDNSGELKRASEEFDEVLEPELISRLSQIMEHTTIARLGYPTYFSSGEFAIRAVLTDSRAGEIREKLSVLEVKHEERMAEIQKEMLASVLGELSSRQRDEARHCLGDFFFCSDSLFSTHWDEVERINLLDKKNSAKP